MQHQHYWWIPMHNWDAEHDFYADGSKGQRIYVHPGTRTVIVQLADDSRQDFPFRKIAHFLAGERYTYPRLIPGILLGAARHGASTDSLRTLYHTLITEQSIRPADFTINEAMMLALARQLAGGARAKPYAIAVAELSIERSPHSAKSRAVLDELEKSPLR
jgi:hypothetical protein